WPDSENGCAGNIGRGERDHLSIGNKATVGFLRRRALIPLIALFAVSIGAGYILPPAPASAFLSQEIAEKDWSESGGGSGGGSAGNAGGSTGESQGPGGSSNDAPDPNATEDPFEGWLTEEDYKSLDGVGPDDDWDKQDELGFGNEGSLAQLEQLRRQGIDYY